MSAADSYHTRAVRVLGHQGYITRTLDDGRFAVEWHEDEETSWVISVWSDPLTAMVDLKYLGWPVSYQIATNRVLHDISETRDLLAGLITDWATSLVNVFREMSIDEDAAWHSVTVDGAIALHDAARVMTCRLQIGLDTLARLLGLETNVATTVRDAYALRDVPRTDG